MIRNQQQLLTCTKVLTLFIAFLFSLNFNLAFAQSNTGKIAGKVVDANSGETLIGASVIITGSAGIGDATDIDGNYTIRGLESGSYSLTVSYVSYSSKNITGVEVTPGKTTQLNVALQPESMEMGEVTVTAQASSSSEAGMLSMQRKSIPMQDGLSSELLSKTGDGDVGSAMKRVTGVTVRNGKDVFVRGLGNRYSNIQLNGSQVPSTDPNTKEAPTDLFGSGLVESIVVQKTYTADQFAEFSGGSVQIVTKEFPYERNFTVSYSTSVNSISTFKNTYTGPGSATDFLGYDNGMRSLPSILDNQRVDDQIANQVARDLHNGWDINSSKKSIPSQSFSINYANQFNEDEMPIGVVSNLSYKFARELEPNKSERFVQYFDNQNVPIFESDYEKDEGIMTAEFSGMLNVFLKPSPVTKLGLKTLYSNSTTDSKTIVQGTYRDGTTRQTVSDFDRRNVFSGTLEAETFFRDFLSSTLSGSISYNRALRVRPDRRNTRYNLLGDRYGFGAFGDNNGHFFSKQSDNNYTGNLKYDFKPADLLNVTTGGTAIVKDRRFTARRLNYRDQIGPQLSDPQYGDLRYDSPGVILSDEHIGNNPLELIETTQFSNDWYDGFQTVYAGFISTNWSVIDRLSIEVGGRVEASTQRIEVPQCIDCAYEEISRVENTDFLPAVNITYGISDRTNLRAAFSQTLARPEFREISDFSFADYVGGQRVYGNPDLKRTNITNYDLRFD